jgi:hypothetical protein
MTISSEQNSITISGNIKSVAHYHTIVEEISNIKEEFKELQIYLLDSISITSSIIGYFCKLVQQENISMNVYVKDEALYALMHELNLVTILNIQKIN